MTVGQHDDNWMNVMSRVVPQAGKDLSELLRWTKMREMRETLKDLLEAGLYAKEEYVRDLKKVAECESFTFDKKES